MIDKRQALYREGQIVTCESDLVNDGSFPDREPDALLVAAGSQGEIVQVGHHEEANIPIYMVEFANGYVVGCFEEELRSDHVAPRVAGVL